VNIVVQVLMELNVANNGIDEFGCFTLLAGLRENTSVSVPVLCGCVHAAGYFPSFFIFL
jgi:hypothetical protein